MGRIKARKAKALFLARPMNLWREEWKEYISWLCEGMSCADKFIMDEVVILEKIWGVVVVLKRRWEVLRKCGSSSAAK